MAVKRLRRYAIDQAMAAARDPAIDAATKEKLMQHVSNIAIGPSVYGRLVYRFIAIALGLVALLVVVFSFALLLGKHTVDSAFYTLGSAAVGALGGVFAPHGDGTTPPVPPGTQAAGPQAQAGPGGAGAQPEQPGH